MWCLPFILKRVFAFRELVSSLEFSYLSSYIVIHLAIRLFSYLAI
jgi:hypothetical protein